MSASNLTGSPTSSPAAAVPLSSLSAQISSLRTLVGVTLAFNIIAICSLAIFLCHQQWTMRKNCTGSGADVEAGSSTTTTTTTRSGPVLHPLPPLPQHAYNPYGGFEDIPLNHIPSQAHLRVHGPSGSSTSDTRVSSSHNNSSNNLGRSSHSASNSTSSRRTRQATEQLQPPRAMPPADPQYGGPSVGTDYTRTRREGRYTEEHLNAMGVAGSSNPHSHNVGVSAGSRMLDKIHNS